MGTLWRKARVVNYVPRVVGGTIEFSVHYTQLRLKKIINSPPATINNFNWGNGRSRLPEYIAVLRI